MKNQIKNLNFFFYAKILIMVSVICCIYTLLAYIILLYNKLDTLFSMINNINGTNINQLITNTNNLEKCVLHELGSICK